MFWIIVIAIVVITFIIYKMKDKITKDSLASSYSGVEYHKPVLNNTIVSGNIKYTYDDVKTRHRSYRRHKAFRD